MQDELIKALQKEKEPLVDVYDEDNDLLGTLNRFQLNKLRLYVLEEKTNIDYYIRPHGEPHAGRGKIGSFGVIDNPHANPFKSEVIRRIIEKQTELRKKSSTKTIQ